MRALLAIFAIGCAVLALAPQPQSVVIDVPGFCEHGPCAEQRSAAAAQPIAPTSNGADSASLGSSPSAEPLPSDADSCCGPTDECEVCEVGK